MRIVLRGRLDKRRKKVSMDVAAKACNYLPSPSIERLMLGDKYLWSFNRSGISCVDPEALPCRGIDIDHNRSPDQTPPAAKVLFELFDPDREAVSTVGIEPHSAKALDLSKNDLPRHFASGLKENEAVNTVVVVRVDRLPPTFPLVQYYALDDIDADLPSPLSV
jgi:hypothetical protein